MGKVLLQRDFKEFLQLLNERKVEYLVIGGYAVGHFGCVRGTGDLDIWVSPVDENLDKIIAVLIDFGMPDEGLSRKIFKGKEHIFRLGNPPVRIEIHTSISGVEFDACFKKKEDVVMDGLQVKLISLKDLKKNKLASGRPKDLADYKSLNIRKRRDC